MGVERTFTTPIKKATKQRCGHWSLASYLAEKTMGGIFRRPADKVRFIVKDASNGRTFIISTNEPIKVMLNY